MKKIYIYALVSMFAITAVSCTKVIDLKLANDSGKLVIEGNITNVNGPQYIVLSRNVPFTSTNTYPPVSGATVTVSDDQGNTYPFLEAPAGTYTAPSIAAVADRTYKMTVITGGVTYTATSVMPAAVSLDSVTSKTSNFDPKGNRRGITVHLQDPPGIANQYRFVLWVNGVEVNTVFAFDDEFTDGRYVNGDLVENATDIYAGDSVRVEMQCIDKPIYTYWVTLMNQQRDSPGGGVAPSNPPSNISPACLGYFSAHTTQTLNIVVN
ncbi:DUF4249 domain-containing protein [Mucilaginibacter sp.]|uniref:DUF4249 domain-containing protein n=1 Tax=Mucilaginibacter sp. TaxID=1882438 RepID=UPI00283DAA77|nr:DUF4249 domain-containing protein [Mucilaginibacter sp.]MDR3695082.1 DUF4249 domain-containing protein [Mucilaginibacter sp.]